MVANDISYLCLQSKKLKIFLNHSFIDPIHFNEFDYFQIGVSALLTAADLVGELRDQIQRILE